MTDDAVKPVAFALVHVDRRKTLHPMSDYATAYRDTAVAEELLYTQAAIDAAVAAERERWRKPVFAMHDAVLDTMASGRPIAHLDSACDELVLMLDGRKG